MKTNAVIKKLSPADLPAFKEMLLLFEAVFEMKDFEMPEDTHLQELLENQAFLVFIALNEERVMAGLTAYVLPSYYTPASEVYIYDLAVKTEVQRRGIGRGLISALTDHCKNQGYKEFFVQADDIDTHALEFYRSTGGLAEKVTHFSYPISGKSECSDTGCTGNSEPQG